MHSDVETSLGVKIFAWLITNFAKEIIKQTLSKAWTKYRTHSSEKSVFDYFESMSGQYGTMKILGMNEPVSLEGIYTNLWEVSNRLKNYYHGVAALPEKLAIEKEESADER